MPQRILSISEIRQLLKRFDRTSIHGALSILLAARNVAEILQYHPHLGMLWLERFDVLIKDAEEALSKIEEI